MPLTILSVAYPLAPVSPETAGGAEQILGALDQELTARGHRSIVVASEGSRTHGRLYAAATSTGHGPISDTERLWVEKRTQAAINRALEENRVDLVHMHGLDFAAYKIPHHIPLVATLHLPISSYGDSLLHHPHPTLNLCCVSQSQRDTCLKIPRSISIVENGVPSVSVPYASRENFALVLGRICPEKNTHAALIAGSLAGISVIVAGAVFPYPEHIAYFEERVKPLLGRQRSGLHHRFVGSLSAGQRAHLLARTRCLLHPTLAAETSSLVAMEALAAGTPVIAYRSGALPEIVSHQQTGFLVDTPEEMAAAIASTGEISPKRCRREAATRFTRERMVDQYVNLYRQILLGQASTLRYA